MNTNWMIHTHGDPLGALQKFVKTLWQQADLDVLVVNLMSSPGSRRNAVIVK